MADKKQEPLAFQRFVSCTISDGKGNEVPGIVAKFSDNSIRYTELTPGNNAKRKWVKIEPPLRD